MKRPTHVLLTLLLAAGAVLALWPQIDRFAKQQPHDGVVARFKDEVISRTELADALRDELWQRGEREDALSGEGLRKLRETVLQRLIDGRLVRAARAGQSFARIAPDEEARWHANQLDYDVNRLPEGLAAQRLTPEQLRSRMTEQLQDQAWIEAQIKPALDAVGEQQARAWFDQHQAELTVPERWHAAHVFLTAQVAATHTQDRSAEMAALSAQLQRAPISFEDLAAKHSEDDRSKLRGGDLGWFTAQRMPDEFIKALQTIKPGAVSAPVKTKLGWHLIKLIAYEPKRTPAFDEVSGEILATLRNAARATAVERLLALLRAGAGIDIQRAVVDSTLSTPLPPSS